MCESKSNVAHLCKGIGVRPFKLDDFQGIREWVNNPLVTQSLLDSFIFDHFHNKDETMAFLQGAMEYDPQHIRLVISNAAGKYLGQVAIFNIDHKKGMCEFDIVISCPNNFDKGLGLKSVLIVCDYIKDKVNINEVIAKVRNENKRALKCFQKAAFKIKSNNLNHFELHKVLIPK